MKVNQLYTNCLAQGAYYIESNGEAAIIDPLRETQPYLDLIEKNGVKLKYIFETHFHADFVSGHVDLANKTGATIVYGPTASTSYTIHTAKDEEVFQIGELSITVLHTPGHTPESSTFLLKDEKGENHAIFTGDTLFIGDVGRPDLALKSDVTREDLAGMLFDSLRNKIMPLEDTILVYPAHGAGSACGKSMSKETYDTLGNQKQTNYALRADMTKEEFIKEVLEGLAPPPQYFAKNAMMNKTGYKSIDNILESGLVALSPDEFEGVAKEKNVLILDTRKPQVFKDAFVPKSINIGIDGGFAPWVGTVITDIQQPILLVCDEGREKEVVTRLARVGYDNTLGYLKGGIEAWEAAGKKVDDIISIDANEMSNRLGDNITILDVRKPGEFEAEHAKNAQTFPLDYLWENMNKLDKKKTYFVHCRSGYRSMIASSILQANGYNNLIEIAGGFLAMQKAKIPMTAFVCPSTKK